jgi:hypothetical protein
MTRPSRIFRLLLLLLLAGVPTAAQQTAHVVVVVLDGMRFSETFGDSTFRFIPRMGLLLAQQGTVYTAFYNDGVTSTCSGHASIVTGSWQKLANNGTEVPHAPTVFEYYRKQEKTSSTDNFVILGKQKLGILASSDDAAYGPAYAASVQYSPIPSSDSVSFENFRTVMTLHHPRLLVMNMPGTDIAAHTGDWNRYITAIRQADSIVYEIWSFVQSDTVLRDRTTLFITNDHGRHLDGIDEGFQSHGDGCEGCRHLLLLVLGPDTPTGVSSGVRHAQVDIVPTIGDLLKFDTPLSTGVRLEEAIPRSSGPSRGFPQKLRLLQNYPNPFNPKTVIRYQVATATDVQLVLFDLLGNEVMVLAEGHREAGLYEVGLDASGLTSGIYVYRLKAGKTVLSRTMTLLK